MIMIYPKHPSLGPSAGIPWGRPAMTRTFSGDALPSWKTKTSCSCGEGGAGKEQNMWKVEVGKLFVLAFLNQVLKASHREGGHAVTNMLYPRAHCVLLTRY